MAEPPIRSGRSTPADHDVWRRERWEEIAGTHGKAKVVANAGITGHAPHTLPGVPGTWRTGGSGALTVTATATVWHHDGKGEETIEESVEGMRRRIGSIASMRYEITRQLSAPGEVLQQHLVHVATTDGAHGQVHAAVHFGFDDAGLITRIEEYAHFVPAGREE